MDKMVEEVISKCLPCQLSVGGTFIQPIKTTEMPVKAWSSLAMDFFGPLPNSHELLVVMDEFSRMPVVEEITSSAADYVLPKLDSIFSLMRIPSILKTDNGPPFNGHNSKSFVNILELNIVR